MYYACFCCRCVRAFAIYFHIYEVASFPHLTRKVSAFNDKLIPSLSKVFFQVLLRQDRNFPLFSFFRCLAGCVFLPAFNKLKTRNFQCTLVHLIFTFLNFENTLDWNNLSFTESDHSQIHNNITTTN